MFKNLIYFYLYAIIIMNLGGGLLFSLLKITISGYELLNDNFTIDFITKAKVCEENDLEVCKVDENLYV